MTRLPLLALPLTLAALVAGCGGSDEETEPNAPPASGSSADAVEIVEFAYAPETVTVEAGTELSWVNSDAAAHTATADDGSFDTGTLDKGENDEIALDEPGTYTYFCRFHPFMKGTVEVQ